jgi:hypothetical protein
LQAGASQTSQGYPSSEELKKFVEDDYDSDPEKFFDFQMDVLWRIGPERHSGMLPSR